MIYEPKSYWEERLRQNFSLKHAGHIGFNLVYNKWLYKAKVRVLENALNDLKINCEGKTVLDIGCGTGFWIEFYKSKVAASIVGVDITSISIKKLKRKYPQFKFYKLDIGDDEINIDRKSDIVNVFDVLFHIKDDLKFRKAMSNIARLSRIGSYIFITDLLLDRNEVEHVTFRSLSTYEEEFKRNSLRLIGVTPIHYLLNRPYIFEGIKLTLLKIKVSLDDIMAPIFYYLDKVLLSLERSNLKLIICVKE